MKHIRLIAPLALAAGLLASCKNPADKTTDAKVEEAKEKKLDSGPAGAERYVFTENSKIDFTASKVSGSTKSGGFKSIKGHFTIKDGAPVGNDHKVEIDMTSIWSEAEKLTKHLMNEDFFDVPNYPTSVYDVTSLEKKSDSEYTVTGNLTMHGVTKSVSFPATVAWDGDTVKLASEFDIQRFQWEINFTGAKDDLINDEVILKFNLEAKPE